MNPTTRDSIKAGAFTALWTFIALFGATTIGWSQEVIDWADQGSTGAFPSLSVLASGAVSAFFAALSGLVGTIVRLAQAKTALPGDPPVYDHPVNL
jgi:hypothetical protein